MIRPSSITAIRSAWRIVLRRWAMTKLVRPRISRDSPCWINPSDSESRLLVASSRIRIRGSARTALAMVMRCFCPPLRRTPRSPMIVSYPSGKDSIKASALATRAAA